MKSLWPCESSPWKVYGLVTLGTYFQLEAGLNKVADGFALHAWHDTTKDHEEDTPTRCSLSSKKPMVFNHTHSGHRSQLGIGFKSDEHLIVCLKLRNIKTKWLKVIWRAFIHLPLLTYWLTDIWFFSENHKQTRAEVSEADPLAYRPLQGWPALIDG